MLVGSGAGVPFSPAPFPSLRSGAGNHICDCGYIGDLVAGSPENPDDPMWGTMAHHGRPAPCSQGTCFPPIFLCSPLSLPLPPSFLPSISLQTALPGMVGRGSTRPSHSPLRQLVPMTLHLGLHLCGVWDSPEVPGGLVNLEQLSDNDSGRAWDSLETCSSLPPGVPMVLSLASHSDDPVG